VTAVGLRKMTKGTQYVILHLLLYTNIVLKQKTLLTYYTIMYMKKLVKLTFENIRNSFGKLPQKGVRRRRKNWDIKGTVRYGTAHYLNLLCWDVFLNKLLSL
jgi:hypothetical protein